MVSFKDKLYIRGQSKRFKGKGESDLVKIAAKVNSLGDWKSRSDLIRKGILKGGNLDPLPKKTPLNPVIHSCRKYDGYQVESVYFESIPGFFSTGTLYRPLKQQASMPVLLKPHGHKKNKRYTDGNQYICANFARMGVIVFTYDMVGYSCSTQVDHKILSAFTLQTWNSIRALDFVLTIPGVDPKRIGCTGGSGGGTQTFILTALDDRVCFSAPCVMVSSFFYGGCVCESGLPIHKGEGYATNNAEIAAMAAPRPQLIISDGGDWTRMTPVSEYPFIQNIYKLYDSVHKVENVHLPDEVHNYGPSKREAAYKFFMKHFQLDTSPFEKDNGIIDECPITVEDVSLLKVFNEEFPRPTHALKSEDDIMDAFEKLK
jgi:uncharacterized protein